MVSYLKDADEIIFSTLDDDTFYHMSLVNHYCNQISKHYIVWYYKVKQLHKSFPITNIGIECHYYKKLYLYLLCQEYSPIVKWAVDNHNTTMINWFKQSEQYKQYYIRNIKPMLDAQEIFNVQERVINTIKIFNFVSNKIFMDLYPNYKKSIYDKLIEYQSEETFADLSILFMKEIYHIMLK
jgi:hypothetical protein